MQADQPYTDAELEVAAEALRRHVDVALPYPTARVALGAVLPLHAVRIRGEALATLDRVERDSAADEGTHDPDCWMAHTVCLAARLRRQLNGEAVDGG